VRKENYNNPFHVACRRGSPISSAKPIGPDGGDTLAVGTSRTTVNNLGVAAVDNYSADAAPRPLQAEVIAEVDHGWFREGVTSLWDRVTLGASTPVEGELKEASHVEKSASSSAATIAMGRRGNCQGGWFGTNNRATHGRRRVDPRSKAGLSAHTKIIKYGNANLNVKTCTVFFRCSFSRRFHRSKNQSNRYSTTRVMSFGKITRSAKVGHEQVFFYFNQV
jgi:hypothetical protein